MRSSILVNASKKIFGIIIGKGGRGQNKHFDKKGETFPWQSRVCANVV